MADRNLTYRVIIDTGTARSQAGAVRSAIERELRQIKLPQLDFGQLQNATKDVQALRAEFEKAAQAASNVARSSSEIKPPETTESKNDSGGGGGFALLKGAAVAFAIKEAALQLNKFASGFAQSNTEIKRANVAFVELAGGIGEAEARLIAIQRGAAGAVSQLGAINIANQAAALGLANTAEGFQRITEAARVTVLLSPVINDIGSAITELGLASANLSFRRLDQLGLSVTEVRDRMKELQTANADLGDSQAFLEASVDSLLKKGKNLLDSQVAQASGVERFNVAINEFLDQEGAFSNALENIYGDLAEVINAVFVVTDFGSNKTFNDFLNEKVRQLEDSVDSFESELDRINNGAATNLMGYEFGGIFESIDSLGFGLQDSAKKSFQENAQAAKDQIAPYTALRDAYNAATEAILKGVDGSLSYRKALREITVDVERGILPLENITAAIAEATEEYERLQQIAAQTSSFDRAVQDRRTADVASREFEDNRQAGILDGGDGIGDSLQSRAVDSAAIIGTEVAIATLKEQKAIVDAAIEELIASGVSDPVEIAIALAEIEAQAIAVFDSIEERANSVNIDFAGIDTALAMFDQGFVDFLPGMDDLRSQLIDLQTELSFTGTMTAEQAAELEYLQGAAAAAGGDAAMLADVTNEMGSQFLYTNDTAAALVDQMYQAAAAYMAGSITAEQYAGITSALGNQLLVLASDAGVATGALSQLLAVQGALAGTTGFEIGQRQGGAIGQRIQTQQATRQRDTARREAEQAAKRAAAEAERGAKRAASELEKGAKKARQELEGALKNVPGLFGRSQVTKEQMDGAAAGMPQNFADDYLRRLEDEVVNGKDWADVSIDEARAALEALGVQVSADNKVAFQQFAEAWESGLLFFDAENIAKFINEEAVAKSLELQEKARIGQENIMNAFGVAIDGAVDSAIAGISGGGVSGSAATGLTVPVKAELIPMGEGQTMPTLGGLSPVIDIAAIQGQLATLTLDPLILAATLAEDTGKNIAYELGNQLGANAAILQGHGEGIATIIKAGISSGFALQVDGDQVNTDIVRGLVTRIGGEAQAEQKRLRGIGEGIAGLVVEGTAGGLGVGKDAEGNQRTDIARGYFTALDSQFSASSNFFYLIGQGAASSINSGMTAGLSTATITPTLPETASADFVAALAGMLLQSTDTIKAQGGQVGSILLDGLNESLSVKVNDDQQVHTGLIDGLIFRFSAEIGARKADLLGLGTTTSSHILTGAREQFTPSGAQGGGSNQSAIVNSMIEGIGTGIRASSELLRQRGGTVAREMIGGFSAQFSNEEFKNTLIAAGETMGLYLEIGILSRIRGGSLVEAIGAQVLADITSTVQEPTQ